jgi:DNA-binding XRE family transcriptional regulator
MPIGYSIGLMTANKQADIKSLGVALGRVCIQKGVSVREVADRFGVSRQAIYDWFKGDSVPDSSWNTQIERYIATLKKK